MWSAGQRATGMSCHGGARRQFGEKERSSEFAMTEGAVLTTSSVLANLDAGWKAQRVAEW